MKLTVKEASEYASKIANKQITSSNISYLINYGLINRFNSKDGKCIDEHELVEYYAARAKQTSKKIGGTSPELSFSNLKESDRIKHVHRLHPYKGKYIPQLVEHILERHFSEGQVILNPFNGSGTTLVQCTEMGIHAIGIDVSEFNVMISNVKLCSYDFGELTSVIDEITKKLHARTNSFSEFDKELLGSLKQFNDLYFPSPDFKKEIRTGSKNEKEFSREKVAQFLKGKQHFLSRSTSKGETSFLDVWFTKPVAEEISFLRELIGESSKYKEALSIILSRTARSCRATTHSDLATLSDPVLLPYYCRKHKKICKPVYTLKPRWNQYAKDTVRRLRDFANLRQQSHQLCVNGDSMSIDIMKNAELMSPSLFPICKRGIHGMITSPPYVGLIDYHEQHAYAYEIFGIKRHDELEIGSLSKRRSKKAIANYKEEISKVLLNCKKYLRQNANCFIVVNDDLKLYDEIFASSGMRIVGVESRLVSSRAESNNSYYESIFHVQPT